MDAISLSIFSSRVAAICDEMGAVLQRAALSPNIKDRLDFSCAVFDAHGQLCAQAAHIPVHLGSMAYAMADIVGELTWQAGDMVVLNDPFLGGTHLPDVTLIAPVFVGGALQGFVVNRAHHADIGAQAPGSMPVSRRLDEEGVIIPPSYLLRAGAVDEALLRQVTQRTANPVLARGDFLAQISANRVGAGRLQDLIERMGKASYKQALVALQAYGQRLAQAAIARIPDGSYRFTDYMECDGVGNVDIPVSVCLTVAGEHVIADFDGAAAQVGGNINCPLSVAAAAVYYVFRCLMPEQTPACAGTFRPIELRAPEGSLVNARRPAAVAAGNVETSTRIVDVILGALAQAVPEAVAAASHGTMNNVAMGSRAVGSSWDYYETIGGGMGAGLGGGGLHGVQTHMTNTLNTPIESLEMHFPLRVRRYALNRGSGGIGARPGGDGLIREFEFLVPTTVTLLTERRKRRPWGLAGGEAGALGENLLDGEPLPAKVSFTANPGQRLTIKTPGGGGYGRRLR